MKTKLLALVLLALLAGCKSKKGKEQEETPTTTTGAVTPADIENTLGYGVLKKLKGIWNGPVTSNTPLGNYPEWIVDFRPISESQISSKNELDTLNDIHMSFFIALYNNQYKVIFRNGGSFAGMKRVSYFMADSVKENTGYSYYRFVEILKGKNRAYTEVVFSNDSLYIRSATNKKNTQTTSTSHMAWSAKLQDSTSCQAAVTNFSFPKKVMTKNFSTTFEGQQEAVYYSLSSDVYPESDQPYLGQTTAGYSFLSTYTPTPTKKVFLIVTTQPLFSGFTFNAANLKYRSRYVILAANDLDFVFNYMHPGIYYYYAMYDADGNNTINTGDWVSLSNTTFTLNATGTTSVSTQINFTIP